MEPAAPAVGAHPAVPRARRLSAPARREQLLDIAADLIVAGGVEQLTMEALGRRAGASKTLAYAYFDNLEHVAAALRQRELRQLYRQVEAAAEAARSFDERLAAAFHAYFDIVEERGLLLHQLEQFASSRPVEIGGADDTNEFLQWLAALIRQEFGVEVGEAFGYAALVGINANAHAATWLLSGRSRDQIEAAAVRFTLGGLRSALGARNRMAACGHGLG